MQSMTGKTVLVTGATYGIGLETAAALAGQGARVLLHGRSAARGAAALAEIKRRTPGAAIEFVGADFNALGAVRDLADIVSQRAPRLDVLINNAGAINAHRKLTADGFETTFAVNHLAPFLLTNLLLDRMKAGAPARIVTVASRAHQGPQLNFDDLEGARRYIAYRAYQASKLANILFTRALARRLAGSGVTANSLHPGVVRTGFGKNDPGLLKFGINLAGRFFITPAQGARTSIYLAASPDVAGVSGQYFDKCKAVTPSRAAQDDAAAEKLWAVSARMVEL